MGKIDKAGKEEGLIGYRDPKSDGFPEKLKGTMPEQPLAEGPAVTSPMEFAKEPSPYFEEVLRGELLGQLQKTLSREVEESSETLSDRMHRYVKESAGTAAGNLSDPQSAAFIIYAGLVGESGEVADLIKKLMAHGRKYDRAELFGESGDVFFYLAAAQRLYGRPVVTIEPYLIISNTEEALEMLAQQVAGCTSRFMRESSKMEVTERLSRIASALLSLCREVDMLFSEPTRERDMRQQMDTDLREILEGNKQKLAMRFPSGKFTPEDSLAKADEVKK